jgi:hypothetical protein
MTLVCARSIVPFSSAVPQFTTLPRLGPFPAFSVKTFEPLFSTTTIPSDLGAPASDGVAPDMVLNGSIGSSLRPHCPVPSLPAALDITLPFLSFTGRANGSPLVLTHPGPFSYGTSFALSGFPPLSLRILRPPPARLFLDPMSIRIGLVLSLFDLLGSGRPPTLALFSVASRLLSLLILLLFHIFFAPPSKSTSFELRALSTSS